MDYKGSDFKPGKSLLFDLKVQGKKVKVLVLTAAN